jgi:hypothetical protein
MDCVHMSFLVVMYIQNLSQILVQINRIFISLFQFCVNKKSMFQGGVTEPWHGVGGDITARKNRLPLTAKWLL